MHCPHIWPCFHQAPKISLILLEIFLSQRPLTCSGPFVLNAFPADDVTIGSPPPIDRTLTFTDPSTTPPSVRTFDARVVLDGVTTGGMLSITGISRYRGTIPAGYSLASGGFAALFFDVFGTVVEVKAAGIKPLVTINQMDPVFVEFAVAARYESRIEAPIGVTAEAPSSTLFALERAVSVGAHALEHVAEQIELAVGIRCRRLGGCAHEHDARLNREQRHCRSRRRAKKNE